MIKTVFIFLTLSLLLTKTYGQKDEIYRNEGKTYGHAGSSYNVDILTLESNGEYQLMYQKFYSKKLKNKNIFFDLTTENGTWSKKQDTLYIKSAENKKVVKFLVLKKNKIALVIEEVEISPAKWKKINY